MRSERYGYTFSIIFFEIRPRWSLRDDDESIRKRNRLLKKIADKVKSPCRLIDFAFYLLDNQFALLLPQTTRASAERIIDPLRGLSQESHWEDEMGAALTLDAKLALVSFPEDGRTKPELLTSLSWKAL